MYFPGEDLPKLPAPKYVDTTLPNVRVKDLGELVDGSPVQVVPPFQFSISKKNILSFLLPFFILFNILSGMELVTVIRHDIKTTVSAKEIQPETRSNEVVNTAFFDVYRKNYAQIDDYSSKSVVVYDLSTNVPIYSKNADSRTLIASLTKMASTLVLMEKVDLSKTTQISETIEKIEGGSLTLRKENVFSNKDLIKAAVIASNNQSVFAMQDTLKTVEDMNNLAKTLGLKNTHFSNPAGFDDNGDNYSTANDLIPIAKLFFHNEELRMYASQEKNEIFELHDKKNIRIVNTNDLIKLHIPGVLAGKTGTTAAAGQNLVLLIEKNDRQYLVVLLNGADRYEDAYKVLGRL